MANEPSSARRVVVGRPQLVGARNVWLMARVHLSCIFSARDHMIRLPEECIKTISCPACMVRREAVTESMRRMGWLAMQKASYTCPY